MKNTLILLFALVSLSACAPKFNGQGLQINSQFQPYMDRFVQESNTVGRPVTISDLTIDFYDNMNIPGANGGIVIGLCSMDGLSNPKITINTTWWKLMHNYPADREQLIFHEMGHCVLGLKHDDTKVNAADNNALVPVTIMNSYHFSPYTYGVNYDYYMNQLFGNNPARTIFATGTWAFDMSWYTTPTVASTASVAKAFVQPTASALAGVHSDATIIYPDENGEYDFQNIHCGE